MTVQPGARQGAQTVIDARAASRLRWRCRRGLLENDLFVERFFARHEATLTVSQARALESLMDLPDNDLLDLLLARSEPQGELARPEVIEVLALMRSPRPAAPWTHTIDPARKGPRTP